MSNCSKAEEILGCYTDGAGVRQTIIIHNVYDDDGVVYATAHLDASGNIIDTSAGSVVPGACPVAQPDVEWKTLCEELPDGSIMEFCVRIITYFDTTGAVVEPNIVDYFLPDQITPYVPNDIANAGPCPQCDEKVALGVILDWADLQ